MSKRGHGHGKNRVSILKKVGVGKIWNCYPAVVEPKGKLLDKVRVRGKIEVHPEGRYYIEWRKDGRKREQIKDRVEVVDSARRKALELATNRRGPKPSRKSSRQSTHGCRSRCFLPKGHGTAIARAQHLCHLQILPGAFRDYPREAICSGCEARRSSLIHSQAL